MRTLLLLRHAKSSWGDASLPDIARPLNERGRRAAPLIGGEMRRRGTMPDLVLSSPATRTRETLELVRITAKLDSPVRFDERIYEASVDDLLRVIADAEDEHASILVVGHNPGLENLLTHFTSEVHPMPTAALAALTLDVASWSDVQNTTARLDWFVKPRDLDSRAPED